MIIKYFNNILIITIIFYKNSFNDNKIFNDKKEFFLMIYLKVFFLIIIKIFLMLSLKDYVLMII